MTLALAAAVCIRSLGRSDYAATLQAMRDFTARRGADTADELWLLEHAPVYTLGLGAGPTHGPHAANGIAVLRTERGGDITYHGPGQAVLYTLVDLARRGLQVGEFVRLLERSVLELLAAHGVHGEVRAGAPGVYVEGAKVAALGLRVTRGRCYHGLALNVDMDLAPFAAIDPCGYAGLAVTQTRALGIAGDPGSLGTRLAQIVARSIEDA